MRTVLNCGTDWPVRLGWLCLLLGAGAPALSQSVPAATPSVKGSVNVAGGLSVVPTNDQSADQQAADRYECYTWAVKASRFDPLQGGSAAGLEDFRRAMTACLHGRGYSVSRSAAPAPAPVTPPAPAVVQYPTAINATAINASPSAPELKYHPFEMQIDGGYTAAVGTSNQDLRGGPAGGLGISWFPTAALPLGLRIDGNISSLELTDRTLDLEGAGYTHGRDNVYGGDADLQLDLAHRSARYKFYLLGGVGWYRVQTQLRKVYYRYGTICGWYCEPGYYGTSSETDSTTGWQKSWNAGVGWEAALAPRTSFFIEARYRHMLSSDHNSAATLVPVTLGLRF